jgi:predicted dehydrogenase
MEDHIIRIGIIGAGNIVRQRHLPGLKKISGVKIVAVANRSEETARQVAKDSDIPEVESDWENLIARKDIDAIFIGTPPCMHAELSIAALAAGKHVFCQARMAMNLREAKAMYLAAQKHPHLVAMLCPPPNGMKNGSYLVKLLQEKAIGRIYHFRLSVLNSNYIDPSAPAHWRQKVEISGDNILSVGIYGEVLGRIFGQPKTILAQGKVYIEKRDDYSVNVPDYVSAIGEWENSIIGNMEWSGMAQFPPDEKLSIYGQNGTLVYNFSEDEMWLGKKGDLQIKKLDIPSEYQKEWTVEADFISAIRNGSHPKPDFLTGLNYMMFLEAARISMREGRKIELASLPDHE